MDLDLRKKLEPHPKEGKNALGFFEMCNFKINNTGSRSQTGSGSPLRSVSLQDLDPNYIDLDPELQKKSELPDLHFWDSAHLYRVTHQVV